MSGFKESLIMTIDGNGEGISGMLLQGNKDGIQKLTSNDITTSLGHFYTQIIAFLGYNAFEEYKVMGLAPYGNPQKFAKLFKTFYELHDEGRYSLDFEQSYKLYDFLIPRKHEEPLEQIHKDIAASLQVMIENVVLHMCKHYQKETKNKNLCIAGGVGQNSKMNGAILNSGIFEQVFVQPASHDSGCSIGAGLEIAHQNKKIKLLPQLKHVYWGTDVSKENINTLKNWSSFINFRPSDNSEIAALLAKGCVIGWVQGKSEFGPRALGNRSIIADPRPVTNKDRINAMVKKREGYRPFAPSVLAEVVGDFFIIPNKKQRFNFMSFIVDVQPTWQEKLGAITHVDGTARIQTVEKSVNPKYWDLIEKFGQITGVPILLNTSFNNNAEPIVDSIFDAITCYLTSDLDFLVINDYLIEKKPDFKAYLMQLTVRLPLAARLRCEKKYASLHVLEEDYYLSWNYINKRRKINYKTFNVLNYALNNSWPLIKLMENSEFVSYNLEELIEELFNLWSERWIIMLPHSSVASVNVG
jgi:carbamoyltransferase